MNNKSHNILIEVIEWLTAKANTIPTNSMSGIAQLNLLIELTNFISEQEAKNDNS